MSAKLFITGVTKGIGRACAERFLADGWSVAGVARTVADVEKMRAGGLAEGWAADIANGDLSWLPERAYDVVLLNAAAYTPGTLLATGEDAFERLWATNVMANHRLARRLLPPMLERGRGHLVVVGSTGTDHWKEHMTAYVATKYALRGLFLGWQSELAGTPIRCTLVAPGATLTSSWAGETPPPGILAPERVAEEVLRVVRDGVEGRVTIPSA